MKNGMLATIATLAHAVTRRTRERDPAADYRATFICAMRELWAVARGATVLTIDGWWCQGVANPTRRGRSWIDHIAAVGLVIPPNAQWGVADGDVFVSVGHGRDGVVARRPLESVIPEGAVIHGVWNRADVTAPPVRVEYVRNKSGDPIDVRLVDADGINRLYNGKKRNPALDLPRNALGLFVDTMGLQARRGDVGVWIECDVPPPPARDWERALIAMGGNAWEARGDRPDRRVYIPGWLCEEASGVDVVRHYGKAKSASRDGMAVSVAKAESLLATYRDLNVFWDRNAKAWGTGRDTTLTSVATQRVIAYVTNKIGTFDGIKEAA